MAIHQVKLAEGWRAGQFCVLGIRAGHPAPGPSCPPGSTSHFPHRLWSPQWSRSR